MSKIAFIFPGQGAQKVGMGQDFYENTKIGQDVFDRASELLGFDMAKLCFEPNDMLNITEYTQAAMVTTSIAMTKVLVSKGIIPNVTAGLSLGEYCALVSAGIMSEDDAVKLVRKRGILMQTAVPLGKGAMAAVLSMDGEKIEEIIAPIEGVQIANYNCPGQIVISGKTAAVESAAQALKAAGAKRVLMLNVSGPFHSDMLKEAGRELLIALEEVEVKKPKIPYVSNVTAQYVTDERIVKELLGKQVYSSVKWEQSVRTMLEDGVDTFIEIGPGKTLAGFIKKITKDVMVFNIEKIEDIDVVVEAVK
jgi:malonyl CoA-acyl carrier protein transacylase